MTSWRMTFNSLQENSDNENCEVEVRVYVKAWNIEEGVFYATQKVSEILKLEPHKISFVHAEVLE